MCDGDVRVLLPFTLHISFTFFLFVPTIFFQVLQQQFNQHIFVAEQAMYESEGLDWRQISFRDNQGLIDLISKRPHGLLPICEEHVMISFKREPNNAALLQQMDKTHSPPLPQNQQKPGTEVLAGQENFYAKPRFDFDSGFIIKHFAGDVTYTITDFIEKNRDALNVELKTMLTSSDRPFLCCLFGNNHERRLPGMPGYLDEKHRPGYVPPTDSSAAAAAASAAAASAAGTSAGTAIVSTTVPSSPSSSGSGSGGSHHGSGGSGHNNKSAGTLSVSSKFREQLEELTHTLQQTQPHYIKCIKPNNVKAPGAVSQTLMVQQMRYSGVLEVVRIRREAYPARLQFCELHKVQFINQCFYVFIL